MPLPFLASNALFPYRAAVTMGDSQTDSGALGYRSDLLWSEQAAGMLRQLGCNVRARNFGRDGCKTDFVSPGMGYRMNEAAWLRGAPDLVMIYGGVNDVRVPTAATRSGTTATMTCAGHGYQAGALVTVTGCSPSQYNVTAAAIANVTTNTFDYTMASDPGSSATVPGSARIWLQTQSNLQGLIKMAKFSCRGFVAGQASLPAQGADGDRYLVLTDTSSTGGLARQTWQTWGLPTIAGAGGSAQTVWEYRAGAAGEGGWGRIATASTPADRCLWVLLGGEYYLNYSASAGDTLATAYPDYDAATGLRSMHVAAVNAEATGNPGVLYCDVYAWLRAKIVAGVETQGSFSWHVADANVHPNALGHRYIAEAFVNAIQGQSGLMTALQASAGR